MGQTSWSCTSVVVGRGAIEKQAVSGLSPWARMGPLDPSMRPRIVLLTHSPHRDVCVPTCWQLPLVGRFCLPNALGGWFLFFDLAVVRQSIRDTFTRLDHEAC